MAGSNTNSLQLLIEASADCTVWVTVLPQYLHQLRTPFLLQLHVFLKFAFRFFLVAFTWQIYFQWQGILILIGRWGKRGRSQGIQSATCRLENGTEVEWLLCLALCNRWWEHHDCALLKSMKSFLFHWLLYKPSFIKQDLKDVWTFQTKHHGVNLEKAMLGHRHY